MICTSAVVCGRLARISKAPGVFIEKSALAEANGDPLMHDLIDKWNMDSQLGGLLVSLCLSI